MGKHRLSRWYRFRRWLVRKLAPKDLTIFCFDGVKSVGASNAYDPELGEGWLAVKLQFWDYEVSGSPESGMMAFHLQKKPESEHDSNYQSCDK